MHTVFQVSPVAAKDEAELLDRLIDYAWDGPIAVAREGEALLLDLGALGGDLPRLGEVTGRHVRATEKRAGLPWVAIYNPDDGDG